MSSIEFLTSFQTIYSINYGCIERELLRVNSSVVYSGMSGLQSLLKS